MVFAGCLLFWPVWFSRSILKLSFINPLTIIFVMELPVNLMKLFGGPLLLIENGLFDMGYQFAILMNNIQGLCSLAGVIIFFKVFQYYRIDRYVPFQRVYLTRRDLMRAEYLFLLIFFLSFYLLASSEFGVVNWLFDPRTGYQLYRSGQGHWYALAGSSLSAAFLVGFLSKPSARDIIKKSIIYISLGYLLGSKGYILTFFISTIIFLWFIRWKYLLKSILLGGPLVFILMLFNFYSNSETVDFQEAFLYFDYYKNGADYYRAYLIGEVSLFYGKVASTGFWAYIPRGIWPEKPYIYGAILVADIFYPGAAELTNTPAFGGAVEQFADFGVLGVIVYSIFNIQTISLALSSFLIFRRPGLNFQKITLFLISILLMQYAPSFGLFFPGGLYFLLVGLFLLLIKIMRFKSLKIGIKAPATNI